MSSKLLLLTASLLLAVHLASPSAQAAPVAITGPDGAEVRLNGEFVGFLPLGAPLELPAGRYELRCELPGHQPFEKKFKLLRGQDGLRVVARMIPLRRRTALAGDLLLAGTGQHYAGQHMRGWIYNAAEIGGLLVALTGELQRSNHRKDYLLLMDEYSTQINAGQVLEYKRRAEAAYQDMEDAESLRNAGLIVAGSAVLLSVLDTLALFPGVEAGAGSPATAIPGQGFDELAGASSGWHLALQARF